MDAMIATTAKVVKTVLVPLPALRPWVVDVALLRPDSAGPLVHPPDAAIALVYRGTGPGEGDLRVVGPRSHASYHPGKDLPVCVRIRLRPGAAWRALGLPLGLPLGELLDDGVLLSEVWGGRADRLQERLAGLPDPAAISRTIEDALLTHLPERLDSNDHVLRAAVASLSRPDGHAERIGALARRLAVSERHLRTLFTDRIGLSPKQFARVQRVRSVLAAAGPTGWSRLAAELGYYDQSHLNADFRLLMGTSPAAFREGRLPEATPCAV